MSDVIYRQCKLKRPSDNGTGIVEYVAWLPAKFAVTGKKLIIQEKEWDVEYASSVELSRDNIHDTHALDKVLPSIAKTKK